MIIVLLTFASCNQNHESIRDVDDARVDTIRSVLVNKVSNEVAKTKSDSIDFAYRLLLKCGLINNVFLIKDLISISTYPMQRDLDVSLIKINGNKGFNDFNGGAIYNILLVHKEFEVKSSKWFTSVYEDDFILYRNLDTFLVFDSYSSPVGYSIFVFLKKNSQELFVSDRLDEGDKIDLTDVDFEKLFIKVNNSNGKVLFKRIARIPLAQCL